MAANEQLRISIVYDGECPACAWYFRLQRLERSGLVVDMIDARSRPEVVDAFASRGIDLNRDFVLRVGAAEYVGSEAVHVLSSLGARNGVMRKINFAVFRSRVGARLVYPILRTLRRLLLRILGRSQLSGAALADNADAGTRGANRG